MNAAKPWVSVAAATLIVAPGALATTWIVDDNGGPGVDFVDVQVAVDSALDGDVILVRPGSYPGFTIDGTSLVVVADAGALVRVSSPVAVRNVPVGGKVELDGLDLGWPYASEGPTVTLDTNAGSVRLVDCAVRGRSGLCQSVAWGALRVAICDDVVLLRCAVTGGVGYPEYWDYGCFGSPGSYGLRAEESRLEVLDSQLLGGYGGDGVETHGLPGGDAGRLVASTLRTHRSTFTGGMGGYEGCGSVCNGPVCGFGNPPPRTCQPGADGADLFVDVASVAHHKDSTLTISGPGFRRRVDLAPYCLGTYEACPCGNGGGGIAGCEHSFGLGGAQLDGAGNASVANDTIWLQVTGLNPNATPTGLFFQGTTAVEPGTPFNDGLLCTGGEIRRLKGKTASQGAVAYGFGISGDAPLSATGQVPAGGGTRLYQFWYRNQAPGFCTPERFNMSNGLEIVWGP